MTQNLDLQALNLNALSDGEMMEIDGGSVWRLLGAVVGAVAGFVLGGVIGAIAGAAVGYFFGALIDGEGTIIFD